MDKERQGNREKQRGRSICFFFCYYVDYKIQEENCYGNYFRWSQEASDDDILAQVALLDSVTMTNRYMKRRYRSGEVYRPPLNDIYFNCKDFKYITAWE